VFTPTLRKNEEGGYPTYPLYIAIKGAKVEVDFKRKDAILQTAYMPLPCTLQPRRFSISALVRSKYKSVLIVEDHIQSNIKPVFPPVLGSILPRQAGHAHVYSIYAISLNVDEAIDYDML
jgi:hypothetical protein